MKIFLLQIINS